MEYTKECHVYSTLYPLLIVYNQCNYVELCSHASVKEIVDP